MFKYAIKTLGTKVVEEKPDQVFEKFNCGAKLNRAFGFTSKGVQDGKLRYFWAHGNNILLDRSKLVCTKKELTQLKILSTKQTSPSRVVEKR